MPEIALIGFEGLDESELKSINEILVKRLKKLKIDYSLLRINLKQHKHAKHFMHELTVNLSRAKGRPILAKISDKNLYKALDKVMERLLSEVKHKIRK
ncbi:MAG: hypothetical protein JSW08_03515 [archaeon]|nr:MAG: hypothetical protein JSW08_03515 [archaeon]